MDRPSKRAARGLYFWSEFGSHPHESPSVTPAKAEIEGPKPAIGSDQVETTCREIDVTSERF